MELLDGLDLEELVERFGPIGEARACHLLLQACGSLSEAHEQGLIHRDIKPANIFLTHRGGIFDFVKVLDFGLVRKVGKDSRVTTDDLISGTPAYLAPENMCNPDDVDHRIDLYALGCVAYYLVTGITPFERDSVMQTEMAHVNDTAPSIIESGKSVSPAFEMMVMRCLAKDPQQRYGSAAELQNDIQDIVEAQAWSSADASSWWSSYRAKKQQAAKAQSSESSHIMSKDAGVTLDIAIKR